MLALDHVGSIPRAIRSRLDANRDRLSSVQYFDHLLQWPELKSAAADLDSIIRGSKVLAYHCTKELQPGLIASSGLRTLSLETHIADFIAHVARVAPDLESDFRAGLDRWLQRRETRYREGQVWFCLTRDLVSDGTEDFFTYYGGEALYRAFPESDRCRSFLASLGRAVVVEVSIPADELRLVPTFACARPLITRYARTFNPTFELEDLEGHLLRPVAPSEVLQVHEAPEFLKPTSTVTTG